jgi:hypothetical protein
MTGQHAFCPIYAPVPFISVPFISPPFISPRMHLTISIARRFKANRASLTECPSIGKSIRMLITAERMEDNRDTTMNSSAD